MDRSERTTVIINVSIFRRSNNPEHMYVSLIYENSNFYASWNPSKPIRIGDYGHLQSDQSFAVEGNIFETGLPETFKIARYESTSTEEFKCIVSRHVDEVKQNGTCQLGTSWIHKAKIEQTFAVTHSYGAILVMTDVRYATLEPAGVLKDLIYSTAFNKHQLLVSELYTCSSYARLLAPKQTHAVLVALNASVHQGILRGTDDFKWTHTADGGDFMSGTSKDGKAAFAPLFRLVGREKTFRRLPIRELSPPKWRRVVDNIQLGRSTSRAASPSSFMRIDESRCEDDSDRDSRG